jgi:hypothetical protein
MTRDQIAESDTFARALMEKFNKKTSRDAPGSQLPPQS